MSVGLTDHLTDTEVTSMNKLLIYKVVGGAGGASIIWCFLCSFLLLLSLRRLVKYNVLGECSDIKYADS